MKRLSVVFISLTVMLSAFAQDVEGSWIGKIDLGQASLNLVFHITKKGDVYLTTVDSPDQMAKGIPTSSTTFVDSKLIVDIKALGASFNGVLGSDGKIVGAFSQSGINLPLVLTPKKTVDAALKRPQEPKAPFPYIAEEVVFKNKKAGINLAGTLTLPKDGRRFPAVILVTGSGEQNRDEELMGHKPFLVIADYLTRNGVAVLRYDDRGVGGSQGDFKSATTSDFASDAQAAFTYLKTRKEIDSKKVGVIGHSEGGIVAFKVAAQGNDVAFIVTLASPGVSGKDILLKQNEDLMRAQKVFDSVIANEMVEVSKRYAVLMQNKDIESIRKEFKDVLSNTIKDDEIIAGSVSRMTSPWFIEFLKYNPQTDLVKLKIPLFALNGEEDIQVNADINIDAIKKNVKSKLTTKKYKELNHMFQHTNPGVRPLDYGAIEETISPEVLDDILKWITNTVK